MRIALLSDIHANKPALDAVLAHARRMGAQRFAIAGDIVGYGGEPGPVLDTVMQLAAEGAMIVRGNHDDANEVEGGDMTANAASAAKWTHAQLNADQRAFLASLPMTLRDEDRLYVHADASAPDRWRYVADAESAARSLKATSARIVVCGHAHKPALYSEAPGGRTTAFTPATDQPTPLLRQRRWHVVLGSVGQPRDGDPAAAYAFYDATTCEIAFQRVAYNVEAAAAAIRAAGLPDILAARLFRGR